MRSTEKSAAFRTRLATTPPAHARKFRTYEDAQTYIDTQMPEWARPSHHPASYRSGSFIMEDAGLRALLNAGVPISDAMLSATPGRLRVWLR